MKPRLALFDALLIAMRISLKGLRDQQNKFYIYDVHFEADTVCMIELQVSKEFFITLALT